MTNISQLNEAHDVAVGTADATVAYMGDIKVWTAHDISSGSSVKFLSKHSQATILSDQRTYDLWESDLLDSPPFTEEEQRLRDANRANTSRVIRFSYSYDNGQRRISATTRSGQQYWRNPVGSPYITTTFEVQRVRVGESSWSTIATESDFVTARSYAEFSDPEGTVHVREGGLSYSEIVRQNVRLYYRLNNAGTYYNALDNNAQYRLKVTEANSLLDEAYVAFSEVHTYNQYRRIEVTLSEGNDLLPTYYNEWSTRLLGRAIPQSDIDQLTAPREIQLMEGEASRSVTAVPDDSPFNETGLTGTWYGPYTSLQDGNWSNGIYGLPATYAGIHWRTNDVQYPNAETVASSSSVLTVSPNVNDTEVMYVYEVRNNSAQSVGTAVLRVRTELKKYTVDADSPLHILLSDAGTPFRSDGVDYFTEIFAVLGDTNSRIIAATYTGSVPVHAHYHYIKTGNGPWSFEQKVVPDNDGYVNYGEPLSRGKALAAPDGLVYAVSYESRLCNTPHIVERPFGLSSISYPDHQSREKNVLDVFRPNQPTCQVPNGTNDDGELHNLLDEKMPTNDFFNVGYHYFSNAVINSGGTRVIFGTNNTGYRNGVNSGGFTLWDLKSNENKCKLIGKYAKHPDATPNPEDYNYPLGSEFSVIEQHDMDHAGENIALHLTTIKSKAYSRHVKSSELKVFRVTGGNYFDALETAVSTPSLSEVQTLTLPVLNEAGDRHKYSLTETTQTIPKDVKISGDGNYIFYKSHMELNDSDGVLREGIVLRVWRKGSDGLFSFASDNKIFSNEILSVNINLNFVSYDGSKILFDTWGGAGSDTAYIFERLPDDSYVERRPSASFFPYALNDNRRRSLPYVRFDAMSNDGKTVVTSSITPNNTYTPGYGEFKVMTTE